jgi:hypothetical protein
MLRMNHKSVVPHVFRRGRLGRFYASHESQIWGGAKRKVTRSASGCKQPDLRKPAMFFNTCEAKITRSVCYIIITSLPIWTLPYSSSTDQ